MKTANADLSWRASLATLYSCVIQDWFRAIIP